MAVEKDDLPTSSASSGVGSSAKTAEASEAHFCVPYLRNKWHSRFRPLQNIALLSLSNARADPSLGESVAAFQKLSGSLERHLGVC